MLIETLVALGAQVRVAACNIFSTQVSDAAYNCGNVIQQVVDCSSSLGLVV